MQELVFMVFGLGFFVFVIWLVVHTSNNDRDHRDHIRAVEYERRLSEAREFGYDPKHQQNQKTLNQ